MDLKDKQNKLELNDFKGIDSEKPIILQDTAKLSIEQMLSIDKKRIEENKFIPRFFKEKEYKIIKVLSEKADKYYLYKTHPVLNYIIVEKSNKSNLIEDLLHLFKKENPNWYVEDYQNEKFGINALNNYLRDDVDRVGVVVNNPEEKLIYINEDGIKCFNCFQNSALLVARPNVKDCENRFPTIKAVLMNLCRNEQDYYDFVINWLSYLYQHPTYRFNVSLVFIGGHGGGKGLFGTTLQTIFGNCFYAGNSNDLSSKFNGQIFEGKLLFIGNEIKDGEHKFQFSNTIKEFSTEKWLTVENKFEKRYTARNFVKFIFFANSSDPLAIEPGDRRYFVVKSKALVMDYEQRNKFVDDIDGFFTNEVNAFCSYLNNYPADQQKVINSPPMTPEKQDIIDINITDFKAEILDIMEDNKKYWLFTPIDKKLFPCMEHKDLRTKYNFDKKDKDKMSEKKFGARISMNGFEKDHKTININSRDGRDELRSMHIVLIPDELVK